MSKPSRSKSNRELPEEGSHMAMCKGVIDLGTQESKNPDWADRKIILLLFELTDLSTKQEPVFQTMQLTFTSKSKNLLKIMKSWRGVKDLADYDMEDALNKPALVTIEHNGDYANITAVVAPPKGTKVPKGFMSPVSCFLDDTFDEDAFEALPDWIKSKIVDASEYEDVANPRPKKKARKDEEDDRSARKSNKREEKAPAKKSRR